jgi:GTP-binding protein HflX
VEADLVLHLRDISDPDTAAQATDVERILADLGVDATDPAHVIEVWNKIDRLKGSEEDVLENAVGANHIAPLTISAITGEGIPILLDHIETRIAGELEPVELTLPADKLGLTDLVYRRGTVLFRQDNDDGSVSLRILATAAARNEIEARLGHGIRG